MEMLDEYPRRATTLDQSTLVGHLETSAPALHANIELYLRQSFPGSEEVAGILLEVARQHPTTLRVKELFETVECAVLIGRDISEANCQAKKTRQGRAISHIYDLACGHGLLGVLLAYRFSQCEVACVDLAKRDGFEHILAIFEAMGTPASSLQDARVLPNLCFLEGDIATCAIAPGGGSYVTCVHGCNELSSRVVEAARESEAAWAVMPCCIRDGLYTVEHTTNVDDNQRYAAMVGVLAGTYQASLIAAIDSRITNRNLCAFGGWMRPRRPQKPIAPGPHGHTAIQGIL